VIKPGRKWLVISLSAALVLSAGAYLINKVAYANDPEWGPYLVYNQQRGTISGTPRASGAAADEPLWDSIGWGKSGYALFSNWYFIDNQVFTVDSFKVINSVHANRFNDLQQVKDTLDNLIKETGWKWLRACWSLSTLYSFRADLLFGGFYPRLHCLSIQQV